MTDRIAGQHAFALAVTAGLMMVAPVAQAQDAGWAALVIGNPSRNAPQAFADSFHVSDALKAAGLGPVTLERDIGADAMATALDGLTGQPQVLLYFAGPLAAQDAGTMLMGTGGGDARAALDPLLARLAGAGTTDIAVLIEDCAVPAGAEGMAGRLTLPALPPGLRVMVAASAGPEGACGGPRLTDLLTNPNGGATLADRLAGLWIGADPGPGFGPAFAGGTAPAPAAPAAEPAPQADPVIATTEAPATTETPVVATAAADDLLVIDTDAPLIAVVPDDVVVIASTVTPVTTDATVTPARLSASDLSVVDDQTVVFVAPAASQIAALPLAQGLPEPSIIIGLIAGTQASYDVVPDAAPADVSQNEISYDNLEARRALREQDPDLFKGLVEGGAFDPPDVDLARALQTELSRMGCYTSTIDGDWGNGSRASVERYFTQLDGQTAVTLEPTVELFRQVIVQDEIECPAPVVAQAAPRAASTARSNTQAAAPRAAAAAPAPRAAAPAPAPATGGLNSATALGGVFR